MDTALLHSGAGFFVCLVFLGQHLKYMEVPRLGVQLELELLAYTTATAMPDPEQSVTYTTHHSSRQQPILNPLNEARDQTCVLMDANWIRFH